MVVLADGGVAARPSWNPVIDIEQMWSYPFMVNAYRAGTIIAVTAAVIGYFVVTRRQAFTAHSLAMVGFPGAAGATLLGVSAVYGYFGFCVGAALLLAALPTRGHGRIAVESAATATVQATLLGFGYLFMSLYQGNLSDVNSLLFGTFFGVSDGQVLLLGAVGVVVLAALAALGRPLLFASLDPDLAGASGVPVRALSVAFLALLGAATAEASQITGTLLVFALLVIPPATAVRLTGRPALGMLFGALIGLVVVWLALAFAYFTPYPLGFYVTSFAFAGFALATGWARAASWRQRRARGRQQGARHTGAEPSADARGARAVSRA
jgi:zinc/manganese transport system permease protein